MIEIWERSISPILLTVRRTYLVKNLGETRVSKVKKNLENPETKVNTIAFEGMVVEPHNTYSNMWQFRLTDDGVEGRPMGGHTYYPKDGTPRVGKSEWMSTPWVPQEAVEAVTKSV